MSAFALMMILVAVIFAGDAAVRLWRQTAWRRRFDDDDDGLLMP
jgi:hypothetical protein